MSPKVLIIGSGTVLFSIFIGLNILFNPLLSTTSVDAIRNYPYSQQPLFRSKFKRKPKKYIVLPLVMMLIISRLIGYKLLYWDTKSENKNPKD